MAGLMRSFALALVLLASCLLGGETALAAVPSPLSDCGHNQVLTHHYSDAALQHALETIPATEKEYTLCYTVIQDQLYKQLGKKIPGSGGTSAGGGSSSTTILIVVVIVIVLVGGGFALVAARRRGGGTSSDASGGSEAGAPGPDDPPGGGSSV